MKKQSKNIKLNYVKQKQKKGVCFKCFVKKNQKRIFMENKRDLVFEEFVSMNVLPEPLLNYLQELDKIQKGSINSVRFNRCKKDAQKLLSNWIDMAGGLMFGKYLFEFQVEFEFFSEKLYKDIIALQKKFDQKKQRKVEAAARRFLRRVKDLPVPSEIFIICFINEKDLAQIFVSAKQDLAENVVPAKQDLAENAVPAKQDLAENVVPAKQDLAENVVPAKQNLKQGWDHVKDMWGITPAFEKALALDDLLEKERENNEKVLQELYINTPYGPVSKSFLKKQTIKIDTGCRIKIDTGSRTYRKK